MAQFPADIVADILSRLPVEAILRFRCVSKPWCALIDSPHFVKLHLKRSIDTKSNRQLILTTSDRNCSRLYSVSMDSLDVAVKLNVPSSKDVPLFRRNRGRNRGSLHVLGSCHGLVLLHRITTCQVFIWNPSTRKYQILPSISDDANNIIKKPIQPTNELFGIAYNSVHDDYIVLKIIQFPSSENVSQVQVYSLKTNSWTKIIADFPYYVLGVHGGVLANDAFHWVACSIHFHIGDRPFVVAFDLSTMDHRLVPIPSFDDKDKTFLRMEVAALEGRLCILRHYQYNPCDVWVMKDYGVKDSWTRLLPFPPPRDMISFLYLVPIALAVDGTKVLLLKDRKELVWYDLQHNIFTTVNLRGLPIISCAEFCMQSLVPLGRDGTSNGTKQHKEDSKDKKPKGDEKKRGGFLLEGSSSRSRQV